MSFNHDFTRRSSMSTPLGTKSFERKLADIECRLRFITYRLAEWRKYGDINDHEVCMNFRKYLCDEIERQILADVKVRAAFDPPHKPLI